MNDDPDPDPLIRCNGCPFADRRGIPITDQQAQLCGTWGLDHERPCPTPATLEEARTRVLEVLRCRESK
jgi:hypothetical protein